MGETIYYAVASEDPAKTTQLAAEQEARRDAEDALQRMSRLQSITAALSRALPRAGVLETISHQVKAALSADMVAVLEQDEAQTDLILVHAAGLPEEMAQRWSRISLHRPLPVRDVAQTQMPVFIENPTEWFERWPNPDPGKLRFEDGAWAVLPLLIGDDLMGVINLSWKKQRAFSEVDRQFMLALAGQCAQALDRARLFEAEIRARAEAESASLAKSQFLAVMSHELRTPLTAIIGYADLLHSEVSGTLTEKQKEQLGRMRSSAWHLLHLISEILSLTRIEAGREQVDIRAVDTGAIARECIAAVQLQAAQKGLEIELAMPDSPPQIFSDAGKLRQILLNLLSNAVKFTDTGAISMRLDETEEGGAEFCVQDTGPGIAPADQEKIFDTFTQLDQSTTRTVGGAGLGLTVSRRLAKLVGAELSVESEPGRGACFMVRLPRVAAGNPGLVA